MFWLEAAFGKGEDGSHLMGSLVTTVSELLNMNQRGLQPFKEVSAVGFPVQE